MNGNLTGFWEVFLGTVAGMIFVIGLVVGIIIYQFGWV